MFAQSVLFQRSVLALRDVKRDFKPLQHLWQFFGNKVLKARVPIQEYDRDASSRWHILNSVDVSCGFHAKTGHLPERRSSGASSPQRHREVQRERLGRRQWATGGLLDARVLGMMPEACVAGGYFDFEKGNKRYSTVRNHPNGLWASFSSRLPMSWHRFREVD